MARTADHNATRPSTAASGQRRPARQRAPEAEAAVVLTPDGHQWLLARAAWLAAEPDQAGWGDGAYARGPAELARLNEILALAITTEELPPELRGVVELGDEVLVEFAADEVERFLLVDPVEAPLDDVASRSSRRWQRPCSAAGSVSRSRWTPRPVATAAASSPPVGTGRGTWALYPVGAEVVVVHPDGAVSGLAADVAAEVGRLAAQERQGELDPQAAQTIQQRY